MLVYRESINCKYWQGGVMSKSMTHWFNDWQKSNYRFTEPDNSLLGKRKRGVREKERKISDRGHSNKREGGKKHIEVERGKMKVDRILAPHKGVHSFSVHWFRTPSSLHLWTNSLVMSPAQHGTSGAVTRTTRTVPLANQTWGMEVMVFLQPWTWVILH